MSLIDWVSGKDENKDRRRADNDAHRSNKQDWRYRNRTARDNYYFQVDSQEAQKHNQEITLAFQEDELQRSYDFNEENRQYIFGQQNRAYDKAVSAKIGNDEFADIARRVSTQQQDTWRDEQLREASFQKENSVLDYMTQTAGIKHARLKQDTWRDEKLQEASYQKQDSVLDYMTKTAGIKHDRRTVWLEKESKTGELELNRHNARTDARFAESKSKLSYQSGIGKAGVARRVARSGAQIKAQSTIVEAMKAAGKARVSSGAGRSNAKSVQAMLHESGVRQTAIANELMFREQGIDLDIAVLKDTLLYDQAMVTALQDRAENSFSLGQATVDANADLKNIKLMVDRELLDEGFATKQNQIEDTLKSLGKRDAVVRAKIKMDSEQIDRGFATKQKQIEATLESLGKRDDVVRAKIEMDYEQTLRNNEAALMLKPEITPAYDNPQEYLKNYDEEGNEIGWGLPRPVYPEIPDFREIPEPVKMKSARVPTGWAAAPGIIAEGAGIAASAFTGIAALPNVSFGAGMVNATNVLGQISNFGNMLGGGQPTYTPMSYTPNMKIGGNSSNINNTPLYGLSAGRVSGNLF